MRCCVCQTHLDALLRWDTKNMRLSPLCIAISKLSVFPICARVSCIYCLLKSSIELARESAVFVMDSIKLKPAEGHSVCTAACFPCNIHTSSKLPYIHKSTTPLLCQIALLLLGYNQADQIWEQTEDRFKVFNLFHSAPLFIFKTVWDTHWWVLSRQFDLDILPEVIKINPADGTMMMRLLWNDVSPDAYLKAWQACKVWW